MKTKKDTLSVDFNQYVKAKPRSGMSFVSSSLDDLKNLSKEAGKAILSNTNHKIVLKCQQGN
jgi:hypothetical protein